MSTAKPGFAGCQVLSGWSAGPFFLWLVSLCLCLFVIAPIAHSLRLPWEGEHHGDDGLFTLVSPETALSIDRQTELLRKSGATPLSSHLLARPSLSPSLLHTNEDPSASSQPRRPAVTFVSLSDNQRAVANVTVPWEGMPVEAVLIGTRGGGDIWPDVYAGIMRAAWQENVTVYVYIQPDNIRDGKNRLQEAGANVFDLENPAKTVWLPFEVNSAWMRDYGPHFYFSNTSKALEGGILGAIYDRPGDYYVAADFARKRVDLPYTKLNLEFEWGNFQTNGKGLCIISDRVPSEEWPEFDKAGCVDLAVVSALDGEPTGHVDLFMFWADPNTLVIGVYTEAQDPINHKIMLEVADSLRKKYGKKYGFAVELMPMPSNCPRVGLKVPESCPDTTDVKIYRSYTNLLHLNKKLLVPVYQESTTYQQQALKMLASVANGRYKNGIVPINSDVVIRMEGAVHCITKTVPKGIIKSHCPTYLDSAFGGVSILCDNHGKCLSNRCACENGFKGESCSSPA